MTVAGNTQPAAWQSVAQLIMSFLGGGLVVAVFNSVREARSERKRRRIEYLRKQLDGLYGPLHFFAIQNQQLINLHNQHGEPPENMTGIRQC
jgi:hypothetical protein